MQKIASFEVDHTKLKSGIYVSRIDGDITTYDLRTRKPNNDSLDYIDNTTAHTFEHMFATYIRNSIIGDSVIYFGPMGCQTGYYLLVRNANNDVVYASVIDTLTKIYHHKGDVFGNTEKECGNYKNLDLKRAIKEAQRYYLDLYCNASRGENTFVYPNE